MNGDAICRGHCGREAGENMSRAEDGRDDCAGPEEREVNERGGS